MNVSLHHSSSDTYSDKFTLDVYDKLTCLLRTQRATCALASDDVSVSNQSSFKVRWIVVRKSQWPWPMASNNKPRTSSSLSQNECLIKLWHSIDATAGQTNGQTIGKRTTCLGISNFRTTSNASCDTCAIIMLINQRLDLSHLPGGRIIWAAIKFSLILILTNRIGYRKY